MNGGAEEDRTPDLRIANATLSQLSYRPTKRELYQPKTVLPTGQGAGASAAFASGSTTSTSVTSSLPGSSLGI